MRIIISIIMFIMYVYSIGILMVFLNRFANYINSETKKQEKNEFDSEAYSGVPFADAQVVPLRGSLFARPFWAFVLLRSTRTDMSIITKTKLQKPTPNAQKGLPAAPLRATHAGKVENRTEGSIGNGLRPGDSFF